MKMRVSAARIAALAILGLLILVPQSLRSANPFSPEDALAFKRVSEAAISPSGEWIAYTVSVPRAASDEAGGAWSELWLVSTKAGEPRPFITGKVNASGLRWQSRRLGPRLPHGARRESENPGVDDSRRRAARPCRSRAPRRASRPSAGTRRATKSPTSRRRRSRSARRSSTRRATDSSSTRRISRTEISTC